MEKSNWLRIPPDSSTDETMTSKGKKGKRSPPKAGSSSKTNSPDKSIASIPEHEDTTSVASKKTILKKPSPDDKKSSSSKSGSPSDQSSIQLGERGDGLAGKWLSKLFPGNNGTPSPQESEIEFSPSTAEDTVTAHTQDGDTDASASVTLGSSTTVETSNQAPTPMRTDHSPNTYIPSPERITLGGMDDLDEDPRDMLLHMMDVAMSNIGAGASLFTDNEKIVLKKLWMDWGLVSWNTVSDAMMHINNSKAILSDTAATLKEFYQNISPKHPGHKMVMLFAGWGVYFAGRHVSKIRSLEIDTPISEYRMFGDKSFC